MNKVSPLMRECEHIVLNDGGFENVRLTDFKLTLILDYDFDTTNSSDVYFVLDEDAENNFNFSFEKDYKLRKIKLTVYGDKNQNFKIKGIGRDRYR